MSIVISAECMGQQSPLPLASLESFGLQLTMRNDALTFALNPGTSPQVSESAPRPQDLYSASRQGVKMETMPPKC